MAGLSAKLEEQLTDLRSNQIAYKLTIENHDNAPVRLLAVESRMPLGARLLEVTDTSRRHMPSVLSCAMILIGYCANICGSPRLIFVGLAG